MFRQLTDLGVSTWIVSLLAHWYSHQQVCVQWGSTTSTFFFVGNGTKQGGVLSPSLFNCYVRNLILCVIESNIGCNIRGVPTNIFAYADDMILLAPVCRALRQLINILGDCAYNIDMSCNANKTVCIIFPQRIKERLLLTHFHI